MKAEKIMTRNVYTCSPDDSLEQAARVMWDSDVGCLVVTDGQQKPVGMITDRDVAMAAYTQGVPLRDAHVANAMSKHVMTCSARTSLGDIESMMQAAQIRRVPVVDANGALIGIVALGDIARNACSTPFHRTEIPGLANTLASITERRWSDVAAAQ
jgi:CBS domain-containing protein